MGRQKLWEITELKVAEPRSVWIQHVDFDLILQMRKQSPREVKWLACEHQPTRGELGLEFRSAFQNSALHWASQGGRSHWQAPHLFSCSAWRVCSHVGPLLCVENIYVQSEAGVIPGWQASVLRILHKTAGGTLNTFCHVFVPKQWWCLYFLAITLF